MVPNLSVNRTARKLSLWVPSVLRVRRPVTSNVMRLGTPLAQMSARAIIRPLPWRQNGSPRYCSFDCDNGGVASQPRQPNGNLLLLGSFRGEPETCLGLSVF